MAHRNPSSGRHSHELPNSMDIAAMRFLHASCRCGLRPRLQGSSRLQLLAFPAPSTCILTPAIHLTQEEHMKQRLFMAGAILSLVSAAAYAQTGFPEKWVTDPPAAAAEDGGGGGRGGGRGRGGAGEPRLDLKVDGSTVTGTIFEGGAELPIKEGTVSGKQLKFKTVRSNNGVDLNVNWTADLTDDNTISLS